MVYQNKLVAAIKVAGKVLRETANTVTLPFGCEYSVLVKNLDSRRVQVKISVDGKDATEGTWLVIAANSSIELERFISNGNFERGNRFKFIERSGAVEAHRGIGAEDGLVRVEYKRERVVHEEETIIRKTIREEYDPWIFPRPYPRPRPWPGVPMRGMSPRPRAAGISGRTMPTSARRASMPTMDSSVSMDSFFPEVERGDAGITVAGSESNQKFVNAAWFETEGQSEVIVLKLRGHVGEIPVETPITVERKSKCSSCGRTNKATASFCSTCGTALSII